MVGEDGEGIGVGADEGVADAAGEAGATDRVDVGVEALAVSADEGSGDGDLGGAAGLGVGHAEVAEECGLGLGVEFAEGEDLEAVGVEGACGEDVERGDRVLGEQEVGAEDEDARRAARSDEVAERAGEGAWGVGGGVVGGERGGEEEGGEALEGGLAADGGEGLERGPAGSGEDGGEDAGLVGEPDVPEGEGEAECGDEFAGVAGVHGGGGVEDEVEGLVLVLAEEFDEDAVEASEDVPVESAEVVAREVVAVVVELDAGPTAAGAAFAGEFAGEDAAGEEVEAIEPGGEPGREEVVEGSGARG